MVEKDQVKSWLQEIPMEQDNHHSNERDTAFDWLAWEQHGSTIENLEERLWPFLKVQNTDSLWQVIFALSLFGSAKSASLLIPFLANAATPIRVEVAACLGKLSNPVAVEALGMACLSDPDSNVRANACIALGELGEARALVFLAKAEADPEPFVTECAREAKIKLEA